MGGRCSRGETVGSDELLMEPRAAPANTRSRKQAFSRARGGPRRRRRGSSLIRPSSLATFVKMSLARLNRAKARAFVPAIGARAAPRRAAYLREGRFQSHFCPFSITQSQEASRPVIVAPKGQAQQKHSSASLNTPKRHYASEASGLSISSVDDALRASRVFQWRYLADVCLLANAAGTLRVFRIGTSRILRRAVEESLRDRKARAHNKVVPLPTLIQTVTHANAEGRRVAFFTCVLRVKWASRTT